MYANVTVRIIIWIAEDEDALEEPSCASWDDQWDYETVWQAVAAMAQWEPETEAEPAGWYRHPSSGRRRPGGDPAQEQVRP